MIIYIIITAIIILLIIKSIISAPIGYQDEAGFHYGKPDLKIMDGDKNDCV